MKELAPLGGEKSSSYAHKTGSQHLSFFPKFWTSTRFILKSNIKHICASICHAQTGGDDYLNLLFVLEILLVNLIQTLVCLTLPHLCVCITAMVIYKFISFSAAQLYDLSYIHLHYPTTPLTFNSALYCTIIFAPRNFSLFIKFCTFRCST